MQPPEFVDPGERLAVPPGEALTEALRRLDRPNRPRAERTVRVNVTLNGTTTTIHDES